ncbi:hypothetical protein [Streptomyces sp. NPDC001165]|uniref:hypothetical protein n=1 Tax=Streptomyces sp. NPDC001165 TaxID=3364546 RepID=UPI0036B536CF
MKYMVLNGAGLGYPRDTATLRRAGQGSVAADGLLRDTTEQLTAYYVGEASES